MMTFSFERDSTMLPRNREQDGALNQLTGRTTSPSIGRRDITSVISRRRTDRDQRAKLSPESAFYHQSTAEPDMT